MFIRSLDIILSSLFHDGLEHILLGDFNFDVNARVKTLTTKRFLSIMRFHDLSQIICDFIRITSHLRTLIDLFFTTNPEHYISEVIQVDFSDHSAIYGVRKLHLLPAPSPRYIERRNYRSFDINLFKNTLYHVLWEVLELESDVEAAWNLFKDLFMVIADKHAPATKRRVRGKSLPWITPCIKEIMKQREYQHRMAIKTNKEIFWSAYRKLRNSVTAKLRKERDNYYSTKLAGKQDQREMWKTLKEILPISKKVGGSASSVAGLTAEKFNTFFTNIVLKLKNLFFERDSGLPVILDPRTCNAFQLAEITSDFVARELSNLKMNKATGLDDLSARLLKDAGTTITKPIAYIINLSFKSGKIPSDWKSAKVIPIYKAGKKNDEDNYRPISILPLVSKIMERAVQIQLLQHLTENQVLSTHQSGFRKKHSTETAIAFFSDCILKNMNEKLITGTIFIDLKKAFDLVNHKCLIHKLDHYGIRDQSLSWFREYSTTRTHRTQYGNELSNSLPITCGVPQGSILGRLLFVIYINDLPKCLTQCSIMMYADDTVIYLGGKSTLQIANILQQDFDNIARWIFCNRLIVNLSKSKCMAFGTRQKLSDTNDFNILAR